MILYLEEDPDYKELSLPQHINLSRMLSNIKLYLPKYIAT